MAACELPRLQRPGCRNRDPVSAPDSSLHSRRIHLPRRKSGAILLLRRGQSQLQHRLARRRAAILLNHPHRRKLAPRGRDGHSAVRRIAGFLTATYSVGNFTSTLTSVYASRSDDSTFLGGYDFAAGNSLLLPNRNLDYGYARFNVGVTYRLNSWMSIYTQTNNMLNQSHIAPIGYPSLPVTVQSGVKIALGGHSSK